MFTEMVENCWQVMVSGVDKFVVAYMHIICPGSWGKIHCISSRPIPLLCSFLDLYGYLLR